MKTLIMTWNELWTTQDYMEVDEDMTRPQAPSKKRRRNTRGGVYGFRF